MLHPKNIFPPLRQFAIWLVFPIFTTILGLPLVMSPATRILAMIAAILVWGVTLVGLLRFEYVVRVLQYSRRHVFFFWVASVLYISAAVIGWEIVARIVTCANLSAINYDLFPCYNNVAPIFTFIQSVSVTKIGPVVELFYLAIVIWLFIFVSAFGLTAQEIRQNGQRLAQLRYTNMLISATVLIILGLGLEMGTRFLLDMSHRNAYTFLQQDWMLRHWQPLNELGYRDYSISDEASEDRQQVLIAGDSFTAGWGVKNVADTFVQQFAAAQVEKYAVHLVAQPNFDTVAELNALKTYPITPDLVVLAYYINDIEFVNVDARSQYISTVEVERSTALRWIANSLYFPNLLINSFMGPRSEKTYVDFLNEQYNDPAVWAQQQQNLSDLIEWTGQQNAQIIALIWPDLGELDKSRASTDLVANYFESQAIPTVNLSDRFEGQASETLIASPFDFHPNENAHSQAAEELSNRLVDILTSPS